MSTVTTHGPTTWKARFDRDGYVVIPGFFTAGETEHLCAEIERYVRDVAPGLPPGEVMYEDQSRPETLKQLPHIAEHDEALRFLLHAGKTVSLAETLLDGAVVPRELEWFNKMPHHSRPTPPHQDGYYFMIEPAEALTMWVALDDVDEQNGCLRYVRGSHREGLRPHVRSEVLGFSQGIPDYDANELAKEVAVPARRGDILVHHCLTIHSAHANTSPDRQRRSLGMVYYSARAKQDVERLQAYQRRLVEDWKAAKRI